MKTINLIMKQNQNKTLLKSADHFNVIIRKSSNQIQSNPKDIKGPKERDKNPTTEFVSFNCAQFYIVLGT